MCVGPAAMPRSKRPRTSTNLRRMVLLAELLELELPDGRVAVERQPALALIVLLHAAKEALPGTHGLGHGV